mmetsp:Transcript_13223/g.28143  ORF Transcript_13223/g.28143 Transcript_13223/m.28143 type:complete len:308 (+) Transcript_13223:301-1224(+)
MLLIGRRKSPAPLKCQILHEPQDVHFCVKAFAPFILLLSSLNGGSAEAQADGCRYVFLDVGANVGIHTRFLFEAWRFPRSVYASRIFDQYFPAARNRSDVCAFAFEPNPAHLPRLQALQKSYRAYGWRVGIIPVAASAADGTLQFLQLRTAREKKHLDWGFSESPPDGRFVHHAATGEAVVVDNSSNKLQRHTVKAIDLSKWLWRHVHYRRVPEKKLPSDVPPAVVMKMDIEGSEFKVLPRLIFTGALCQITAATVEFHEHKCQALNSCRQQASLLRQMMALGVNASGCALRELSELDDETYATFAK